MARYECITIADRLLPRYGSFAIRVIETGHVIAEGRMELRIAQDMCEIINDAFEMGVEHGRTQELGRTNALLKNLLNLQSVTSDAERDQIMDHIRETYL